MNVLISGGAGFIGSHLCRRILKESYKVICIDNFITGSKENIIDILENENFQLIEYDIANPIDSLNIGGIEYIFHLASPASPVDYQRFSIETLLVNSIGTYNLLKLAQIQKCKFLLASTSEVYGDPEEHPQREDYWGNVNPVGPRSCYDESKRFAESLTMEFLRKFDLDVRIVRIFNTYGPFMKLNDGRVVPNFIYQAISNLPITVYGDGSQTRSFCYVSDMVEGIYRAMFTEGTKREIVNLGNPCEISIIEFAKTIKKLCNSPSEIKFEKLPEDDPTKRRPYIEKAKKVLNWEPKVGLEEGIMQTIEWLKKRINGDKK